MMRAPPLRARARGFTLTELAIVAMIIALLAGGLLMTLAAQNDNRELADARRTLDVARDALIGFAVANGRLPCPATAISGGREDPVGGGACTITLDAGAGSATQPGFVPAITLGIGPTNGAGQLIDAWGNPVRYAVTRVTASIPAGVSANAFTTAGLLRAAGYTGLTTDLVVCVDLPGAAAGVCAANRAPTPVAAVVFSTGKTGASGPLGPDEQENLNVGVAATQNPVFVTHVPLADFDDLVVSLSAPVLYGRLVAAGAL
jgi:prepilin-type N-terminal cleavage/methylation domain-containing protein